MRRYWTRGPQAGVDQEFVDPAVVREAGEERDRGLDHAPCLGDHAGAAAEAGEPVALAGMVALDAVRLLLADEQPALRDQLGVGRPAVGAVEADAQRSSRSNQSHVPSGRALKRSKEAGIIIKDNYRFTICHNQCRSAGRTFRLTQSELQGSYVFSAAPPRGRPDLSAVSSPARIPSRSAMLTSSANEAAWTFSITL